MSDELQFTVPRPPSYGELTDLLPGLFWVRLPMPTLPNHVNCWLLDNGPGWTLVDCGFDTDDVFEIWDKYPVYNVVRDSGWYQFGYLLGAGSPVAGTLTGSRFPLVSSWRSRRS